MSDWAIQSSGNDALDVQLQFLLTRIKALETQVGALSSQVTALKGAAAAPPTVAPAPPVPVDAYGDVLQAGRQGGQQVAGGTGPGEALTLLGNASATDRGVIQAYAGSHLWYSAPDVATQAERMRLTSAGLLGLGTSTPGAQFEIVDTTNASLLASGYGTGNRPVLTLRSARGTLLSPGALVSGDKLWSWFGGGYDGTAWRQGTAIESITTAAPTGFGVASDIVFGTSDGTDVPVERMRLTSIGRLGIGTSSPLKLLHTVFTGASGDASPMFDTYSTNNPAWFLRRARGTAAAPAAVVNGDLSSLNLAFHDGSAFFNSAIIRAVIRGTPDTAGTGRIPVDLVFFLSWNVAGLTAEKLRLTGDGRLGLNMGANTIPTATMQVKSIPLNVASTTLELDGIATQTGPLLVLQADTAGATHDLLQSKGAAGGINTRLQYQGILLQHNNSPAGAAEMANGEFCFYYNTANTFINVRVRDATGTIKTGTINVV